MCRPQHADFPARALTRSRTIRRVFEAIVSRRGGQRMNLRDTPASTVASSSSATVSTVRNAASVPQLLPARQRELSAAVLDVADGHRHSHAQPTWSRLPL